MKDIYCLVMHDQDETCGSREAEVLHTTNKQRLEDLRNKLNKKVRNNPSFSFYVKTITPKSMLSRKDVQEAMNIFERYGVEV